MFNGDPQAEQNRLASRDEAPQDGQFRGKPISLPKSHRRVFIAAEPGRHGRYCSSRASPHCAYVVQKQNSFVPYSQYPIVRMVSDPDNPITGREGEYPVTAPRRRARVLRLFKQRAMPAKPEDIPSVPRAPGPSTNSFGKIARYLALADIALNNDHTKTAAKSTRLAEETRAEQSDLETRMQQLIETYHANRAMTEIDSRTHRPDGAYGRKTA